MSEWYHPRGALARGPWETVVDDHVTGWQHTGLRIAQLDDTSVDLEAGPVERMVVPLAGSFAVTGPGGVVQLEGRASVFDGPTDVMYLPVGTAATISGSGRVAVAEAPATAVRPAAYLPRAEVPVELRGAGRSSRQVHNFGTPGALDAQKLIVCEVITPAENWSSFPPHKHDQATGTESRLEEIYYFETAVTRGTEAPAAADPFAMFATYSSPAGRIDVNALVRSGDVALVPFGYHGPAVAAPGYDLYYLNVMAGPDEQRAWKISDDPAHAWVRATWDGQDIDPRLPYLAKEQR
ncbi:5-deoxy-glucuronate isomerase [Leifsonia sp. TF02-11]|uniref:5-deoxy-glucuronate isomerase n=1 Tax=Leifsonia sp. TF02-11 TaxID=2815212 RepID=UPI001AA1CDAD|nr:5-deoxy-glucuronate isomerase [Leifsonia sp. TF02-11]MBO1740762.1 5-deoxy-glucuronate isomerase [Leifsonia sp. TF02-11]